MQGVALTKKPHPAMRAQLDLPFGIEKDEDGAGAVLQLCDLGAATIRVDQCLAVVTVEFPEHNNAPIRPVSTQYGPAERRLAVHPGPRKLAE